MRRGIDSGLNYFLRVLAMPLTIVTVGLVHLTFFPIAVFLVRFLDVVGAGQERTRCVELGR